MPTVNDLKQSRFLTKGDVARPLLLTIAGYHEENVALSGEPPEKKWCLDFHEISKPLVLNSTKGQIIEQICGSDDFDNWIGRKIVVEVDPNISMRGKVVGGLSVRAPRNKPAPAPAPRPASPKPPGPARPASVVEPAEVDDPPEGDDVPF